MDVGLARLKFELNELFVSALPSIDLNLTILLGTWGMGTYRFLMLLLLLLSSMLGRSALEA